MKNRRRAGPIAFLLAAIITAAGLLTAPRLVAQAHASIPPEACGPLAGSLCRQFCTKECSNGSCCDWTFWNYF